MEITEHFSPCQKKKKVFIYRVDMKDSSLTPPSSESNTDTKSFSSASNLSSLHSTGARIKDALTQFEAITDEVSRDKEKKSAEVKERNVRLKAIKNLIDSLS